DEDIQDPLYPGTQGAVDKIDGDVFVLDMGPGEAEKHGQGGKQTRYLVRSGDGPIEKETSRHVADGPEHEHEQDDSAYVVQSTTQTMDRPHSTPPPAGTRAAALSQHRLSQHR